jgi:hypothetical protein
MKLFLRLKRLNKEDKSFEKIHIQLLMKQFYLSLCRIDKAFFSNGRG